MGRRRSFTSPFGERRRSSAPDGALVSRGLVVESGPQHRTRQALRAVEHLSREVVEGLEEGVVVVDQHGRAVSWNASALQAMGLASDALPGEGPLLVRPQLRGEDGAAISAHDDPVARALTGETAVVTLRRLATPVAEAGWLTVAARPIRPPGGDAQVGGAVCTLNDVTAAVTATRRLREERDRATRYLEVASTLVVVLDAFGIVELVNEQGCELLGVREEDLVGRDWFDAAIPSADRLHARMAFHRLVSGVEPPGSSLETFLRTRDGERRRIAWRNAVLVDDEGRVTSVVRSGEDLTQRREAEAQVAYLAYHDALTGLANRALLEEQLQRDLARARRVAGQVALIEFDLDDFKLINDSFGHAAGDAVLRQTAERVSTLTRAGDLLARQGGDEFLLLLDTTGSPDPLAAAEAIATRVGALLDQPFAVSGAEFHVRASVGVALFPDHAQDAEGLLGRADSAMYQAKRAGGAGVAVYEAEDGDARQRLALTTRLRHAIGSGELRLHYQPIMRVGTDPAVAAELVGFEALVRWEHPERGLVPPGEFIPIAEETGLIDEIGDWVVEALCAQAATWAAMGHRPELAFNLSPHQLRRARLVADIAERIAAHGLDPSQFCAELTESAVLSDQTRQRSALLELREAGIAVALDDFGSGESSLGRLRDLPVDVLKVDRSFLRRVPEDDGSTAVVAAVLALGRALGTDVVVEGVETPEQLAFLRASGGVLVQGFLLGRPMPAEHVLPLLAVPLEA